MATCTASQEGKLFLFKEGMRAYDGQVNVNVDLFTAPSTPTDASNYADYTLASYSGYSGAGDVINGVTPFINSSSDAEADGSLMTFNPPSSGSPVNIYGLLVSARWAHDSSFHALGFYLFPSGPLSFGPGASPLKYYLRAIMGQASGY